MFAPFIMSPMGEEQLKRVLKEKLTEQFMADGGTDDAKVA